MLEKEIFIEDPTLNDSSLEKYFSYHVNYSSFPNYLEKLNEFYLTASIALLKSLSNNVFHENLFPSHDCIEFDKGLSKRDKAVLQTIIDYLEKVSIELIDYESNPLISQKSGSIPYLIQKLKKQVN